MAQEGVDVGLTQSGRRYSRVFPLLFVLFFWVFGVTGCTEKSEPPTAPRAVLMDTVREGSSPHAVRYTGEVRSRYETMLSFRVGGKLIERTVNVGARVKSGDVLARLDPQDFALSATAAAAQKAQAAAELERYKRLYTQKFVSRSALEARETAYASIAAQAALAENQSAYTVLRADKPGVIDQLFVEAGQVVQPGAPVMRHSRTDALEVLLSIPENKVPEVRASRGAKIYLWAQAGTEYDGVLRELSPMPDTATRTYTARVRIENPDEKLLLGMTAEVSFLSDTQKRELSTRTMRVPLGAIFQKDTAPAVWVITPENTVRLEAVKVLRFDEESAEITGGIERGARIVVAGVHKLHAGEKVKPVASMEFK